MKSFSVLFLVLLLALTAPGFADEQVRVGLLPVVVRGDFQPLNSEQVTELLHEGLLANQDGKSRVKLILLDRQDSIQTLPQAVEFGKSQNLDMVIWGDVSFQKDSYTDLSPSPYYRGRLRLQVTTEGALKVAWVPEEKLVLSQPTLVTSNQRTRNWVSDDLRDLSEEQTMAANAVQEVADSLVIVLRKRANAGWLHQP